MYDLSLSLCPKCVKLITIAREMKENDICRNIKSTVNIMMKRVVKNGNGGYKNNSSCYVYKDKHGT